jgi:hypothetical protein
MKEDKLSSCIGLVFQGLVITLVTVLADGWALSTIWNWYIPTIFGLTRLTIAKAIGVAMVFSLFTRTNKLKTNDNNNKYDGVYALYYEAIVGVLTAVFTVGIAWIVLQFAF